MIYINSRFLTQPITGVQRYAIELSLRLKEIDSTIKFICPKNILHQDLFEKLGAEAIGNKVGHLWEQIDLPIFLKKQGHPILVNLCNTAPIFYKNKVSVVHDIIYKLYPKSCSFMFRLWYLFLIPIIVKSSLKLITVSEFSRKEISKLFCYSEDQIAVVYNSVNDYFICSKEKKDVTSKYLLAVSSMVYHKNYERMIDAFVNLCKATDIKVDLFVVGGTSRSLAKQSYDISNSPIHFLGRVSDEQLIELYQNAEAFIFPSLYEGFGIPPLEAQACGCPVVSSNSSAMPEVLNDSAVYFDPTDTKDIQDAMYNILSDMNLRESKIEKGTKNVSRFSWDSSAKELYQVLNNITNG